MVWGQAICSILTAFDFLLIPTTDHLKWFGNDQKCNIDLYSLVDYCVTWYKLQEVHFLFPERILCCTWLSTCWKCKWRHNTSELSFKAFVNVFWQYILFCALKAGLFIYLFKYWEEWIRKYFFLYHQNFVFSYVPLNHIAPCVKMT